MKNLFSENRLVFLEGLAGKESAPQSADIPKNDLIKLTKNILGVSPDDDNQQLKNKAKDFMQNHETNPVARTDKIKSFLKNSTDPKLNEKQVDTGVQKIDDAIQHLAYQRLV